MRIFLISTFTFLFLSQSFASNLVQATINKSETEGFKLIKQYKTMLGRTVLELESQTHVRQIVINPTNKLIMRDFREKKHLNEEDNGWFGNIKEGLFAEGDESGGDNE